jgi:chemotaxis protein MotB
MHKASWVFVLAVSLMLTAGCKNDELQAKDARIAELEASGQATGTSLEQCKKDRENLNKLVKGYTGEINAMEAALADAAAREAQAAKRLEEYNSMVKQLKSMVDAGKLKIRIVRNKMVIELPEAVLFPSGSAKLKPEGVRVLAELGPILASIKDRDFQVGGHTDNKPIRTARFPSNWELSGARSIDVAKLLVEYGVPGTRVSAAAYADTQPVADNATNEGRALNRRIEIALQPNLNELPNLAKEVGAKAE